VAPELQRELDSDHVQTNKYLKTDNKRHQDLGCSSRTQRTDRRQTQRCQGTSKNHQDSGDSGLFWGSVALG